MSSLIVTIVIMLIIVVVLVSSIRIAEEDERFAVFILGKFSGFRGPGLVLIAPHIHKVLKLKVGDLGVLTSPEFAEFDGVAIPVTPSNDFKNGQSVQVDGFNGTEPRLVASSDRELTQCPNCGYQL